MMGMVAESLPGLIRTNPLEVEPMPKGHYTRPILRPIQRVIGPSIAYVPLTKGLFSLIEAEDIPIVDSKNWFAHWCSKGKRYYALRRDGVGGTPMHREITGVGPDTHVDHRNSNSLDNRRHANLRKASRDQNMANRKLHRNNTTGFKGVIKRSPTRYRAQVNSGGKKFLCGTFDTPEEAHAAYCAKAKELHGEFARFA